MKNPEIPVGKSNGSCHSVWEAPENMGCDLRRAIFSVFRGLPFDFWGGYGWFQKKICCILFLREKKSCKEIPGGKNILQWKKVSLVVYNAVKKSYTVKCSGGGGGEGLYPQGVEKKILPQPKPAVSPPPPPSQMVDPLVDLDMFCTPTASNFSFMFTLQIFTRVVWPLVSSKTVCNTIGPQTPQANVSSRKLHVMFI